MPDTPAERMSGVLVGHAIEVGFGRGAVAEAIREGSRRRNVPTASENMMMLN